MLAMYLSRQLTGSSFPEIGQRFDKDHSTVINACRRIEEMLQSDAELRALVNALRDRLTAARAS
jgi:chromosomal replication initiator protein